MGFLSVLLERLSDDLGSNRGASWGLVRYWGLRFAARLVLSR